MSREWYAGTNLIPGCLWPARGPPEAPCAAPQCGNGAPAPLVSASTDFPNDYG